MKAHLLEQLRSLRDAAFGEITTALRIATLQAGGHRIQDIQRQLNLTNVELKAARGRLKAATEELAQPD
jgi:hypothetical protein